MKLKFGIIGFGFMGQTHTEMLTKLDYTEVIGVADINPVQLKNAPAGVKTYTSADELLKNDDINTVIISVPNHLHLEMVKKVAASGKDVLCEKPVAMSVAELNEMIKVTKEAGVHFTVHHQRRWDKDYRLTKAVLESKSLGDVYTIKNQLYGFNGNMHDWHIYPEFGGGMLYDWGVHLLDQMLWMIPGKLKTVYADVRNVINKDVDDYFNIQLYFDSGITAQVELGTYFLSDKDGWFERHWFIAGNKGTAYVDGFFPEGKIVRTTALLQNVPGKITMSAAGPTRSFGPAPEGRIVTEELPEVESGHENYFKYYNDYINNGGDLVVKPEQMVRLLKLVEAIRKAALEHKTIDFE
ncbi:Gfo/Idh/MocA family oxidoreductase [Lactococcus cremoris]|uniref:Gfo/Idh/MocA family protein n=1 Tax=Lactococcus lactis subsp. cremoris TaxID=1359 RepID=UPI00287119A6|nr:Gfo/Idh/MocA family oxidoreductase [Lactococcus cremoris]MDR9868223.1 Gfo/Idh/MocA family oxidoreductase [Lactococcus cremoris]